MPDKLYPTYEKSFVETCVREFMTMNLEPHPPEGMIPIAVRAVNDMNSGKNDPIPLPEGFVFRKRKSITPQECISKFHLEHFIDKGKVGADG